jgi:hypothetical protein
VVVGAELVSLSALLTLAESGCAVALMTTELPRHQIYFPFLPFKWFAANLLTRAPIVARARISRILGSKRVEAIEIMHLDSGRTEVVDCDTLVFTGDWIPEHELARHGGALLDSATRGPLVDTCLRTSARGVFAAGNLLRGAEAADVAALEGRRAAEHIRDFLERDRWPAAWLTIGGESPVTWISPGALASGDGRPAGSFLFRIGEFCRNVCLQVRQGQRVLYQRRFRRLQPNRSFQLKSSWLASVNPRGEDLRVTIK